MAKAKRTKRKAANDTEAVVSEFTAQHGDYRAGFMPDLDGQNSRSGQKLVRIIRNRATTLVDRWLAEGGPGFDEPQARAIDWVRSLWTSAGHAGPVMSSWGERVGGSGGDGQAQDDALTELSILKDRFPRDYWNVFEDVCRHDMLAGEAGQAITGRRRSAHENARACVGFIASMIAMHRGFSLA